MTFEQVLPNIMMKGCLFFALATVVASDSLMQMTSWDYDRRSQVMRLRFSQNLLDTSIQLNSFRIQESRDITNDSLNGSLNLTCGNIDISGHELFVRMCDEDVHRLVSYNTRESQLAMCTYNSYLFLEQGAVISAQGTPSISTPAVAASLITGIDNTLCKDTAHLLKLWQPASSDLPVSQTECFSHEDCGTGSYCDSSLKCWNNCTDCLDLHDSFDCACPEDCNSYSAPQHLQCSHHTECTTIQGGIPGYCDATFKCWPCTNCSYWQDAYDGECPSICEDQNSQPTANNEPSFAESCTSHEECDTFFCARTNVSNEGQCMHCSLCSSEFDSITGSCPAHCNIPLDVECSSHADCDGAEYCDENFECWPCTYCYEGWPGYDGSCPDQCDQCIPRYTVSPTPAPTISPTSSSPTTNPTISTPTRSPSMHPSSSKPTIAPSASPSAYPTDLPTSRPTSSPSIQPSVASPECVRNCGQLESGGGTCLPGNTSHCTSCDDGKLLVSDVSLMQDVGNCISRITCDKRKVVGGRWAGRSCRCRNPRCHKCVISHIHGEDEPSEVCYKCRDGWFLQGNQTCEPSCDTGKTLSGANLFGRRCLDPFTCQSGRILNFSSSFGCKCPKPDNSAMDANCHTCNFNSAEYGQRCTKCRNGKYLFNDTCHNNCDSVHHMGLIEYKHGNYGSQCREPFLCVLGFDRNRQPCKCKFISPNCQSCNFTTTGNYCIDGSF